MRVKLWPSLGHGWGPFRGGFGFNFFHSHLKATVKWILSSRTLGNTWRPAARRDRCCTCHIQPSPQTPGYGFRPPQTQRQHIQGECLPWRAEQTIGLLLGENKILLDFEPTKHPHQFKSSFWQKTTFSDIEGAASCCDSLGKSKAAAASLPGYGLPKAISCAGVWFGTWGRQASGQVGGAWFGWTLPQQQLYETPPTAKARR